MKCGGSAGAQVCAKFGIAGPGAAQLQGVASLKSEKGRPEGERIAKFLARAGVASRRAVEAMIAERRIAVNETILESPAFFVTPVMRITVDGKPVSQKEPTRLWRYYKPRGLMTTNRDPEGRPTVFEHLPKHLPRVMTIGRLDMDTEGLLLLTNDGALARKLELPANGWQRRYRVRVHGAPPAAKLAALHKGVEIDGISYRSILAVLDRQIGTNCWLTVTLTEGKNREVRRVFEFLGCPVNRLIRIAFGPFELGKLEPGQVEEVPSAKLQALAEGQHAAKNR